MAINPDQLATPFTPDLLAKLDGITSGAQPQPTIASQSVATAGIDNSTMMTPLRVKQSILANGGGGGGGGSGATITGITGSYLNNTGFSLNQVTLVYQDTSGNMNPVTPAVQTQVENILGVLTATTATGNSGVVLLEGLLQNITTSFNIGDIIYLNYDGTLTNVGPDIGVGSFVAGYFIVKVGKITKNTTNHAQVDLAVNIEIIGQL